MVGCVGRELEEEDDAVDGVELGERVGVEREELFELHVFYAEVVEQVGEDALVSLSTIPFIVASVFPPRSPSPQVFGRGVGAAYRIGLDYDLVVSGLDSRALGSSIKLTSIPTAAHLGALTAAASRRQAWCTIGGELLLLWWVRTDEQVANRKVRLFEGSWELTVLRGSTALDRRRLEFEPDM
jgi:hypothetical protein